MSISSEDRKTLEHLEESLWREDTRFDMRLMDTVIAKDFFEFGRSGRTYRREDTMSVKPHGAEATFPLQHLEIREFGEDVVQITYNSRVRFGEVIEYGRRSSIWSRRDRQWILRFHQGTPFHP